MMPSRRGFTLMEVLLVTSLLAMTGAVIFQVFNNGFKLWQYADRLNRQQSTAIALDKIGEDLRSTLPVSGIKFYGTAMQFVFPSLVWTAADRNSSRAGEGTIDQIGAVQYRFEPAEGKLYRRQANYSQALKKQWSPDQEVAGGIEELAFSYYAGEKALSRVSLIENIPAGVMVQLRMKSAPPDHWLKHYYVVPVGE